MTGTPHRTIAVLIAGLFAATGIGLAVLTMRPLQAVPNQFFLDTTAIGGIQTSKLEAEMDRLSLNMALSSIELGIAGEKFLLAPGDIGLHIDTKQTKDRILGQMPRSKEQDLWELWVPKSATVVQPVLQTDMDLLKKSFLSIAEVLDIKPINATISVVNSKIVVTPDQSGRKLNVQAAADTLTELIVVQNNDQTSFLMDEETLFDERPADLLASELLKFQIIANQSEMSFPSSSDALSDVATLFTGTILPEATITLDADKLQLDDDAIDRLATLLYQALLPIEGVEITGRKAAAHVTAYAAAGFEAVLTSGEPLSFTNQTGQSLMLLMALKGDTLSVAVLSDGPVLARELESVILQTLPAPVVESFTHELAPGVSNVLSEGKTGSVVSIRNTADGQELYQDTYAAESRVIETGAKRATVPK